MPQYTELDSIPMMKNPGEWPCVTILPLKHSTKREGAFPLLGFLRLGSGYTVFVENILNIPAYEIARREEYASAEDCFAAGWRVD